MQPQCGSLNMVPIKIETQLGSLNKAALAQEPQYGSLKMTAFILQLSQYTFKSEENAIILLRASAYSIRGSMCLSAHLPVPVSFLKGVSDITNIYHCGGVS